MKDTLTALIVSIVDQKDSVVVEEQIGEEGIINFIVTVAPEEMGKIIGKEGKVIRALRNVMKIPAMKEGKRINISLTDTNPPAESEQVIEPSA